MHQSLLCISLLLATQISHVAAQDECRPIDIREPDSDESRLLAQLKGFNRAICGAADFLERSAQLVEVFVHEERELLSPACRRELMQVSNSLRNAAAGTRYLYNTKSQRYYQFGKGQKHNLGRCYGFAVMENLEESVGAETYVTGPKGRFDTTKPMSASEIKVAAERSLVIFPRRTLGNLNMQLGGAVLAVVCWHEWQHAADGLLATAAGHKRHMAIYVQQADLVEVLDHVWDRVYWRHEPQVKKWIAETARRSDRKDQESSGPRKKDDEDRAAIRRDFAWSKAAGRACSTWANVGSQLNELGAKLGYSQEQLTAIKSRGGWPLTRNLPEDSKKE